MDKKICDMVTARIIDELQKGIIPWQRPWTASGGAVSHTTGKPYSLVNQFILGGAGEWITFNQCRAENGKVKKGAKGRPVVFWKIYKKEILSDSGETEIKSIPVLKYYTVFNVNDCENISNKFDSGVNHVVNQPIEEAQKIVDAWRSECEIEDVDDSDKAYYSPGRDYIRIPNINQYAAVEEFYSTAFHEMTHSTGHKSRLNRFTDSAACAAFSSAEYSKEELIAEIGAASIVNHCGIETGKTFKNSAAYIQGWLSALKNDTTLIIAAAGKAEKAIDMILSKAGIDNPANPTDTGSDKLQ